MSLNQIQLMPHQVAALYSNVLIDTPARTTSDTSSVAFLGGNALKILILVYKLDENFIPEKELLFFCNI